MQYVETPITNFRFNAVHQQNVLKARLYKLKRMDKAFTVSCFSSEEEKIVTQWLLNNDINFHGGKNVHVCDDTNLPDLADDAEPFEGLFPKFFILTKEPKILNNRKKLNECMEIELLDQRGNRIHHYAFDFEIIAALV